MSPMLQTPRREHCQTYSCSSPSSHSSVSSSALTWGARQRTGRVSPESSAVCCSVEARSHRKSCSKGCSGSNFDQFYLSLTLWLGLDPFKWHLTSKFFISVVLKEVVKSQPMFSEVRIVNKHYCAIFYIGFEGINERGSWIFNTSRFMNHDTLKESTKCNSMIWRVFKKLKWPWVT